jgi:hypothetical protein
MKARPLTFTVVALVETLSRWKLHGIEDNNDNNDRADTVQDCFLEYLPQFEILVKRFPDFLLSFLLRRPLLLQKDPKKISRYISMNVTIVNEVGHALLLKEIMSRTINLYIYTQNALSAFDIDEY